MFRTTVLPMRNFHIKPAFWSVDQDLKEVLKNIENVWEGVSPNSGSTDFKETENAYFLSIDLPGVNKNNLSIHVEGEHLFINGTRKRGLSEKEESKQNISQTLLLPKMVDKEKVQAHCEDGVLYLALPKLEKAKAKKIEISEGFRDSSWSNLLSNSEESKEDIK